MLDTGAGVVVSVVTKLTGHHVFAAVAVMMTSTVNPAVDELGGGSGQGRRWRC
jgi:hypothetical protein